MNICYIKFSKNPIFKINKLKGLRPFNDHMKNCSEIIDEKNLIKHCLVYFKNSKCVENLRFGYVKLFTILHSFEYIPFYIYPSKFIFWFRYDLDLVENFSLRFAMSLPLSPIFIYCYDPEEEVKSSYKRKQFLEKTLDNLKIKLSHLNIKLQILSGVITDLIPQMAKKYNSSRIIYSLNTFNPLDYKKEKKLTDVLKKIDVYPLLFILDPLTMKPIFACFKKKFKTFPSFFFNKDSENKIDLTKKRPPNKEKSHFFENNKTLFISNHIPLGIFSKNVFYGSVIWKKDFRNFLKGRIFDFEIDVKLLKNVFSEFNLGFRFSFNTMNKGNIVLSNITDRVKLNSILKIFFFIKKLIKKTFLTKHLMNFI